MVKPLPKTNLSSKQKKFEDNNFKFYESGRNFSKRVENTVERGEIARYEQFFLFLQCLYCIHVKTSDSLGKG